MFKKMAPLYFLVLNDVMAAGIVLTLFPALILKSDLFFSASVSITFRSLFFGVLLACFPLSQFLVSSLLGDFGDKFGRKVVMVYSTLFSCFSMILSGVAIWLGSLSLLIISRFLAGIFSGNRPIAQAAVIDLSTKETKAKNLSRLSFFLSLGFAIGPYFGGKLSDQHLVSWFNFELPFYFSALLFLVNVLSLILFFKETRAPKVQEKVNFTKSFTDIWQVAKFPKLLPLFVIYFIYTFGLFLFGTMFPAYLLEEFHFSQGLIGDFVGYYALSLAVANLWINPLIVRYIQPSKAIFLPTLICSIAIYCVTLPIGITAVWIFIPFVGMTLGISWNNFLATASNQAHDSVQGKVFGIMSSIFALAYFFSTFFAGSLLIHGPKIPLVIGGTLVFIAGFAYFLFSLTLHKEE